MLTAIAGKAASLRDAGIVGRVSIGDVNFELGRVDPAPAPMVAPQDDGRGNAIDDPATYGGHVPEPPWRRAEHPPQDDEE